MNSKTSGDWGRVFRDVLVGKKNIAIHLVVCGKCGFLFYRDVFDHDEISRLYETEHRIYSVSKSSEKPGRKWEIDSLIRFLKCHLPPSFVKTALDVGAGDFLTLDALRPIFHGIRFEAIDPSYGASEYRGIPVYRGMLEDISLKKKYDLVLAIHILEHVSDLRKFTEKLASISGKYIYVEVPYQVGPGLFRDVSVSSQHINYFTPETLSRLLKYFGFKILQIEFDTDGYRHIGMPGMIRLLAQSGREPFVQGNFFGFFSTLVRFFDPRPIFKMFFWR